MWKFLIGLKNHKTFRVFCYGILALYLIFQTLGFITLKRTPVDDFLAFYSGGKLIQTDPENLYDLNSQFKIENVLNTRSVQDLELPFLNPPFVAYFFSPLSNLTYGLALNSWIIINSILLAIICFLSFFELKNQDWYLRIGLIFGILTFGPIYYSILIGQISLVIALFLLLAWIFYRKGQLFYSGFFLSTLLIKPQYIVLLIVAILAKRNRKFFTGFMFGSFMFLVLSLLLIGIEGVNNYLLLLRKASGWVNEYGTLINKQFTPQSLFLHISGTSNITHIHLVGFAWLISISILIFYAWTSKDKKKYLNNIQWAILILGLILASFHTHYQDLTILVVVCTILIRAISPKEKDLVNRLLIPLLALFPLFLFTNMIDSWSLLSIFITVLFMIFLFIALLMLI